MASRAVTIKKGGGGKKQKKAVAHTLPPNFYKNFVPPATPQINPQQAPKGQDIPEFDALPKVSPTKGIMETGSYSMKHRGQFPMSMPAQRGLMGGPSSTFAVTVPSSSSGANAADPLIIEEEEAKGDDLTPHSLVEDTKKLKVGSFTCFAVMSGGLKQMESSPEYKDAASATSQQTASTFASADDNEVAPEPEDGDESEDDAVFEME